MNKKIVFFSAILCCSFFCFSQSNLVKITANNTEDFHASFSPDGEKILFDSEQSGHNEVYLYYIKTKIVKQLTANESIKSDHPTWFGDGKHILFTYWQNGPERYTMNIDGSEKRHLLDGYGIASPKGNKISFIAKKNDNYDMFIIDSDGKNEKQLTNHPGDEIAMHWSPDGNSIFFLCEIEKVFQVCCINTDGSNFKQLSSGKFSCDAPQWNPQGSSIAYSCKTDSNSVLCIINNDGTVKRELIKLKKNIANISWSPGGNKILCSTGNDTNEELAIINIDDGKLTLLTNNKVRDTYPSWSPDEKKILFVSEMDGDLDIYFFELKK